MLLGPLAAANDLLPELLPLWLVPIVELARWLMLVPSILIAAGLLGAFVGSGIDRLSAVAGFAVAGTLTAIGSEIVLSATAAGAVETVRFTAWDPSTAAIPAWPGLLALAIGASYWRFGFDDDAVSPLGLRTHLWIAIAAIVLVVAPRWPLGLAEAGTGAAVWLSGGAASLLPTASRLVLPGALALLAATAAWSANLLLSPRVRGRAAEVGPDLPRGSDGAPTVAALAGLVTVAYSLGLIATLFLPLADPSAVAATTTSLARDFDEYGLRGRGRDVYTSEGCIVCHTQRIREGESDAAYGPAVKRGDYGTGPALAGHRRIGPDLTWVGSRHATRIDMADRMRVHGPGGSPAYTWLFDADGTTPRGDALIDYLVGLKSEGAGR
jgi:mono/diheme cytochrome c family protein